MVLCIYALLLCLLHKQRSNRQEALRSHSLIIVLHFYFLHLNRHKFLLRFYVIYFLYISFISCLIYHYLPHNWFDYPEQKTDKKVHPSARWSGAVVAILKIPSVALRCDDAVRTHLDRVHSFLFIRPLHSFLLPFDPPLLNVSRGYITPEFLASLHKPSTHSVSHAWTSCETCAVFQQRFTAFSPPNQVSGDRWSFFCL